MGVFQCSVFRFRGRRRTLFLKTENLKLKTSLRHWLLAVRARRWQFSRMKSTAPQPPAPASPQKPLRYDPKPKGSWKKIVGSMKDCDLSGEAFRLGAKWRERMNREGK
jgi:hypothetical protein